MTAAVPCFCPYGQKQGKRIYILRPDRLQIKFHHIYECSFDVFHDLLRIWLNLRTVLSKALLFRVGKGFHNHFLNHFRIHKQLVGEAFLTYFINCFNTSF